MKKLPTWAWAAGAAVVAAVFWSRSKKAAASSAEDDGGSGGGGGGGTGIGGGSVEPKAGVPQMQTYPAAPVVPAWGQIQSAVTAHIDQRFAGLDYTYTNQLDAADTARWLAKDALSAVVPSTSWPQSESEIAAFSAAASSAAKAAWSGAQSYAWTLVA